MLSKSTDLTSALDLYTAASHSARLTVRSLAFCPEKLMLKPLIEAMDRLRKEGASRPTGPFPSSILLAQPTTDRCKLSGKVPWVNSFIASMSDEGPRPPGGNQNQMQALYVMTIIMLTLSCMFVALQVIVRASIVKGIWWNDWTIIFTLVSPSRTPTSILL